MDRSSVGKEVGTASMALVLAMVSTNDVISGWRFVGCGAICVLSMEHNLGYVEIRSLEFIRELWQASTFQRLPSHIRGRRE